MAERGIAGDRAKDGPGEHAEDEAPNDPPDRGERMLLELAAARQLDKGVEDHRRRRHQAPVRPAQPYGQLPADSDHDRQKQA